MKSFKNIVDCGSVSSRDTSESLRTLDWNTLRFTNCPITLHTVNAMRTWNRLHVAKACVRLLRAAILVIKVLIALRFELVGVVAVVMVVVDFFFAFKFGFWLRAGTANLVSNCVVLVYLITPLQKAWLYNIRAASYPHDHQLIL